MNLDVIINKYGKKDRRKKNNWEFLPKKEKENWNLEGKPYMICSSSRKSQFFHAPNFTYAHDQINTGSAIGCISSKNTENGSFSSPGL